MQEQPMKTEERKDTDGSLIEQARKLHADIKAENDRKEALLAREEKLQAERMISGQSEAGQEPQKPKEETAREYAQRMARGGK